MVRPSTRAGVPVLNLRTEKPSLMRLSVSSVAGAKPLGPELWRNSPATTEPFRYTPVARMTAFAAMTSPYVVFTPHTFPFSVSISAASPCARVRFSVSSSVFFMRMW